MAFNTLIRVRWHHLKLSIARTYCDSWIITLLISSINLQWLSCHELILIKAERETARRDERPLVALMGHFPAVRLSQVLILFYPFNLDVCDNYQTRHCVDVWSSHSKTLPPVQPDTSIRVWCDTGYYRGWIMRQWAPQYRHVTTPPTRRPSCTAANWKRQRWLHWCNSVVCSRLSLWSRYFVCLWSMCRFKYWFCLFL